MCLCFIIIIFDKINKMENMQAQKNKQKWLPEEQKFIKYLWEEQKIGSWKEISKQLFRKFPRKKRTGTQCRDRYINYLKFGDSNERLKEWSREQQMIIMDHYLNNGSKWKKICDKLTSRSENAVKNKFHSSLRKFMRKINQDLITQKPITYDQLNKIVNFLPEDSHNLTECQKILDFRKIILFEAFKIRNYGGIRLQSDQIARKAHKYTHIIQEFYSDHSQESKLKKNNYYMLCKPIKSTENSSSGVFQSHNLSPSLLIKQKEQDIQYLNMKNSLQSKIVQLFAESYFNAFLQLQNFQYGHNLNPHPQYNHVWLGLDASHQKKQSFDQCIVEEKEIKLQQNLILTEKVHQGTFELMKVNPTFII